MAKDYFGNPDRIPTTKLTSRESSILVKLLTENDYSGNIINIVRDNNIIYSFGEKGIDMYYDITTGKEIFNYNSS